MQRRPQQHCHDLVGFWRVKIEGDHCVAKIDQTGSVQLQRVNCRPSDRGQANDPGEIFAPGEMAIPLLPPGMKERNLFSGLRIDPMSFAGFVFITTTATESQVFKESFSAFRSGNDVVYCEPLGSETLQTAAILASFPGAFNYDLSLGFFYTRLIHMQES